MRAVLYLALLVPAVVTAPGRAEPHAGKVVRVERRPAGLTGMPRYCNLSPNDLTGYCMGGRAPVVGERIDVLDPERHLGVLRISGVQNLPDACPQSAMWMIQGTVDGVELARAKGQPIGVLDVPVDLRAARLVTVDSSPTGHVGTDQIYAVDGNGDGRPDVEFVQFPCDDQGNVGAPPTGTCIEVWGPGRGHAGGAASGGPGGPNGMERLRQDRVRNCY